MDPGRAFPRTRGRPARAAVALCSLMQLPPLPDPNGKREFIRKVVQEVAWNADARAIRLALNLKALAQELPVVMCVCRLDPEYRR